MTDENRQIEELNKLQCPYKKCPAGFPTGHFLFNRVALSIRLV
jgi:hypothetical protein